MSKVTLKPPAALDAIGERKGKRHIGDILALALFIQLLGIVLLGVIGNFLFLRFTSDMTFYSGLQFQLMVAAISLPSTLAVAVAEKRTGKTLSGTVAKWFFAGWLTVLSVIGALHFVFPAALLAMH